MSNLTCEKLATKDELQELRDQLNEYLGNKEDGGKEKVFQLGEGTKKIAGLLAVTMLGTTHVTAGKAITDITLQVAGEKAIWKELANGTAKLIGLKGNGAKASITGLNTVAKTAGQGAGAAAAGAKVASTAAAAIAVLSSLVQIAASLGLNIATVKVIEKRIEAEARGTQQGLNHMNQSMLTLYEKSQGRIDKVNADIAETNRKVELNRVNIRDAENEILKLQKSNQDLVKQLVDLQGTIDDLVEINKEAQEAVNNLEEDYLQTKASFQKSLNQTKQELDKAVDIIDKQKVDIETVNENSELLKERVTGIVKDIDGLKIESEDMRADFEQLKRDLGIKDPNPETKIKTKRFTGKTIIFQPNSDNLALGGGGGGSGASAKASAVATQNAVLDLTNKLNKDNEEKQYAKITIYDSTGDANFNTTFQNFLSDVDTKPDMNEQQITSLKDGISEDVGIKLEDIIKTSIVPGLANFDAPAFDRRMANATKTGICESLNGGSCPTTPNNPNPTQGLQGLKNHLGDGIGALNSLLNKQILGIVKDTNGVVKNAKFGLKAAKEAADFAWKATHADKALQMLNTVLLVNNALYLGRNLGETIGDTASLVLSTLNIKDSTGEAIDVNEAIGNSIQNWIVGRIGQANFTKFEETFAKSNRTYQAVTNLYSGVRTMLASAEDIAEETNFNVAKIGNALRDSGAVENDSYNHMSDSKIPGAKIFARLEAIDDKADSFQNIVSDIKDFKDEAIEFNQDRKDFIDSLTEEKKAVDDLEATETAKIERLPNLSEADKQESENN